MKRQRAAVGNEERPVSKCVLGMAEAAAGNRGTAERLLEEVTGIAKDQYISGYQISLLRLALGRTEEAIATLKQAYADRDWWTVWTPVDPRWDAVRDHPRFRTLPFAGRRGISMQRTQGIPGAEGHKTNGRRLAAVLVIAAGLGRPCIFAFCRAAALPDGEDHEADHQRNCCPCCDLGRWPVRRIHWNAGRQAGRLGA